MRLHVASCRACHRLVVSRPVLGEAPRLIDPDRLDRIGVLVLVGREAIERQGFVGPGEEATRHACPAMGRPVGGRA